MGKTRNTGFSNNAIQYNSGSIAFVSGSTTLLNISSSGNIVTTGTITANTLVVQTVTSSISFVTGSTKFGAISSNTHQFTGSLNVTGALYVATGSVGIGTVSPSQLLEVVGGEIKAGRVDTTNEGGQVSFGRSTDNATAWYIDAYGNVASPQLRFVNVSDAVVAMTITGSNVGIGTSSPSAKLQIVGTVEANGSLYRAVFGTTVQDADMTGITGGNGTEVQIQSPSATRGAFLTIGGGMNFSEAMGGIAFYNSNNVDGKRCRAFIVGGQEGATSGEQGSYLSFGTVDNQGTVPSERMKINRSGIVMVGTTNDNPAENNVKGVAWYQDGRQFISSDNNEVMRINRKTSDGVLVFFHQDGVAEGNISVSGTTVSYNGGHLSRYSQTETYQRIEGLLKGTVMSNLDKMAEWIDPKTGEPYANEQLNCMKISDIEGDVNVAGVFVNWDDDDKSFTSDMNIAMTGDMIIRIAQGVIIEKGQLLMSAGDGTAKPQEDDIVRSKTIAKVTSNHITCVYEDGSYCVPCVLMAC